MIGLGGDFPSRMIVEPNPVYETTSTLTRQSNIELFSDRLLKEFGRLDWEGKLQKFINVDEYWKIPISLS